MSKRSKLSRRAIAAAASILFFVPSAPSAAATQYSVVVLSNQGIAYAVDHGTVVGGDATGLPTVWTNNGTTATHLPLPAGSVGATPYAISGNQIGGYGSTGADTLNHALLWNSSSGLPIDLGSFATVTAISDGVQAGYTSGPNAALWRGSASSLIDLNPSSNVYSGATGIWGGEVSGVWFHDATGSDPHAAVWTSLSPSGFVDLTQPAYVASDALAVSRGQVAGWAGIAGVHHAAIWAGTAASFQDLAPAGTTASELRGTNGTQQVGDVAFLAGGNVDFHAAVWTGTAGSYQLLPVLPGADNRAYDSIAYGIDGEGDIAGAIGSATGPPYLPVLWVPNRLPGDANFDGSVNFSDLLILAEHYGQPGDWVDGEFSGAGTVGFADLLTLAQHYGQSQSGQLYSAVSAGAGDVPEPSAVMALFGCAAIVRRRSVR